MQTVTEFMALQYQRGRHTELTISEETAWLDWIDSEYESIAHLVKVTEEEVSPELLLSHWQSDRVLLISSANSDHPVLTTDENVRFRAIHDWAHCVHGFGFDHAGEYQAFLYAISTAPKSIHWILYSEIALQAAAAIVAGEFQSQKIVHAYWG